MDTEAISAAIKIFEKNSIMYKGLREKPKNTDNDRLRDLLASLYTQLLTVQIDTSNLVDLKRQLEEEIVKIKDWNTKKNQYELKKIASGAFVYATKKDHSGKAPPHWLCTKCFEDSKKSTLQPLGKGLLGAPCFCPECNTRLHTK